MRLTHQQYPLADASRLRIGLPPLIGLLLCLPHAAAGDDDSIELVLRADPGRTTMVACEVSIAGTLTTPGSDREWDVRSTGRFRFEQRQAEPAVPGPSGIRALRRFRDAATETLVGDGHRTTNQLPLSHRLLHVSGTATALRHLSPDVRLARRHVDLLNLPCDPLAVRGLLPSRPLASSDEKWNADPWVLPLLVGLEGVVKESVTCGVSRLSDTVAIVEFTGATEGAVAGAAVTAELTGQLTVNRVDGLVSDFQATLTQERSSGVVSPGLNVTAAVRWTQAVLDDHPLGDVALPDEAPAPAQLLLTLATPWRLALLHSRDWHVFHETADLIMLRLLHQGALVGQCNIAPAQTVAPGEFTPESAWKQSVSDAVAPRGAVLTESRVSTTDSGWRIHHVRATSRTSPPEESKVVAETVFRDYYLCTWKSGEQFSLVFTHTKSDDDRFGTAAEAILESLVVRQNLPTARLPN